MAVSRQLAAIMFTDIVGYTALMGEDEQKAFGLLRRNRQLLKPIIEKFNGTLIKELGDGVLASFHTVTDSVMCAIEIQKACANIDDLKLRIGIHQGEVVFEDNDVFGDGVNIASRLQAGAPTSGIWISESVYKNVSNKKEIKTKFVGEEVLKNVREPVKIYEVMIQDNKQTITSAENTALAYNTMQDKSIAVLPFVNMSDDPSQEYFSDGMSEEIITSLTHLKDLKVAGRTSSFRFKGKNVDLRQVGEKLGVNTVLEGSVRKQGNRVRVTAQLVDVTNGYHLWSEKYDRNMDDIFKIQDEIALTITEQLKVTLFEKERTRITTARTQNPEAYESYLKGRFYINRRGSFITQGLKYFEKAIELDKNFALAYAGYSDACLLLAFYSFTRGSEIMVKAKWAAETAIKLDGSLCEAYCSLATYYLNFEYNFSEAKTNFLKSIELGPEYEQSHSWYGMLFLAFGNGRFDEAIEQGKIAIKLEPLSAIAHADLAWTFYTAARFEEALSLAKTGIELDNSSFLSHRIAGLSYLGLNRYEEALNTFNYLAKISHRHQHAVASLIWVLCSNGNYKEATNEMSELISRSKSEYVAGTHLGLCAAYLNDPDRAFEHLQQAYADRDPMLIQLKYSPSVPTLLRNDPRFQTLLEKIGFPG